MSPRRAWEDKMTRLELERLQPYVEPSIEVYLPVTDQQARRNREILATALEGWKSP